MNTSATGQFSEASRVLIRQNVKHFIVVLLLAVIASVVEKNCDFKTAMLSDIGVILLIPSIPIIAIKLFLFREKKEDETKSQRHSTDQKQTLEKAVELVHSAIMFSACYVILKFAILPLLTVIGSSVWQVLDCALENDVIRIFLIIIAMVAVPLLLFFTFLYLPMMLVLTPTSVIKKVWPSTSDFVEGLSDSSKSQ